VKALVKTASQSGVELQVLQAVEAANERQKHVLVDKVVARFGEDLKGRQFAIWGLAFKPNTDDMREAPSRVIISALLQRGATIKAYDPVAIDEAKRIFEGAAGITFADSQQQALEGSDALLIVTEWKEFKSPEFDAIKSLLRQPVVIDGRNLYDPPFMASLGIEYSGIGRGSSPR
jgi:UDPglucose 6-dehydrogenase